MSQKPIICVVDDEPSILLNYQTLFEDDFEVLSFPNPELFLNHLTVNKKAPNLVISDYKMPQMSGLEMIKKAHLNGFQFPFILLSGYLNKQNVMEAMEVGAFRILEKPVDFETLSQTVERLLIEHDMHMIRKEIRHITSELRELYSGIRIVLMQYIPEDIIDRLIVDAPNGKVKEKMSFEKLLERLESRLEKLLESEKVLEELRTNKAS